MAKKPLSTEEIKKKIETLFKLIDELKDEGDKAKDELSRIDRELSNQYHKIEGSTIDYMSDSHLLITKLKDILYQRRDAKINHTILESVVSIFTAPKTKASKRYEDIIKKHDEIVNEIVRRAKR